MFSQNDTYIYVRKTRLLHENDDLRIIPMSRDNPYNPKEQADMITEINREAAKKIRSLVEAHLTTMLEDNGLKVDMGNCVYDEDGVKFTGMRFSLLDAMDPEERALIEHNDFCKRYEDVHFDLDKVGENHQGKWSLVGYKSRNRKYPFIALNLGDNKRYKITERNAQRLFGVRKEAMASSEAIGN